MELLTRRNGKGVRLRQTWKVLKRFGVSLELFSERIELREGEIEALKLNQEIGEGKKGDIMKSERMKNIADVLEEMDALIDTHFDEFSETKSSRFLEKVIDSQGVIETAFFKKTWRTLNCTPKNNEGDRGKSWNPPLCQQEERDDHKEDYGDEELVQQDRAATQCQAQCELLQKSGWRDQCPPLYYGEYPP